MLPTLRPMFFSEALLSSCEPAVPSARDSSGGGSEAAGEMRWPEGAPASLLIRMQELLLASRRCLGGRLPCTRAPESQQPQQSSKPQPTWCPPPTTAATAAATAPPLATAAHVEPSVTPEDVTLQPAPADDGAPSTGPLGRASPPRRRLGALSHRLGLAPAAAAATERPVPGRAMGADFVGASLVFGVSCAALSTAELLARQRTLELLYESRFASLQRFIGFTVALHAMGKAVQDFWPRVSLGLLKYDMSRSQSMMRIASTASPVSGMEVRERAQQLRCIREWESG